MIVCPWTVLLSYKSKTITIIFSFGDFSVYAIIDEHVKKHFKTYGSIKI